MIACFACGARECCCSHVEGSQHALKILQPNTAAARPKTLLSIAVCHHADAQSLGMEAWDGQVSMA